MGTKRNGNGNGVENGTCWDGIGWERNGIRTERDENGCCMDIVWPFFDLFAEQQNMASSFVGSIFLYTGYQ